jgi:hypothetical protein
MKKLAIMKLPAPYSPFARSLTNVDRSSKNEGTYATAMNDMKAEPKKMALICARGSDPDREGPPR